MVLTFLWRSEHLLLLLLIGQNENTESPTLCIIKAVQLLLNDLRSVSNKKNNYVIVILVMIKLNSPIFRHPS